MCAIYKEIFGCTKWKLAELYSQNINCGELLIYTTILIIKVVKVQCIAPVTQAMYIHTPSKSGTEGHTLGWQV